MEPTRISRIPERNSTSSASESRQTAVAPPGRDLTRFNPDGFRPASNSPAAAAVAVNREPAPHFLPVIPLLGEAEPAALPLLRSSGTRASAIRPGHEIVPGVWYAGPADLKPLMDRYRIVVSGPVRAVFADPQRVIIRPIFTDGDALLPPSFVRRQPGLVAAANGTYFAFTGGTVGDLLADGSVARISDGRLGSWGVPFGDRRYSLAVDRQGHIKFLYGGLDRHGGPVIFQGFMGGLGVLFLRDGTPAPGDYKPPPLPPDRPHTLVGLRADGGLIIVTVGTGDGFDGRGGGSMRNLSALMRSLEAVEAYYLDGGGSTNLIVPATELPGISRRPVTSYLGIFR